MLRLVLCWVRVRSQASCLSPARPAAASVLPAIGLQSLLVHHTVAQPVWKHPCAAAACYCLLAHAGLT